MVSHYFLTAVLWFEPAQAYVVTKLLNTPTTRLQTHAGHVRQHLHSDGRRVLSILPHAISRELKLDRGSIAWCTAQERWCLMEKRRKKRGQWHHRGRPFRME